MNSLSTSEIDARALDISKAAVAAYPNLDNDGRESAQWRIADLIPLSEIPTEVSRSSSGPTSLQERRDLIIGLQTILIDKCVQRRPNGDWYLDLARIAAGTSFSGWMRQLAKTATRHALRQQRMSTRETSPSDPFENPGEATRIALVSPARDEGEEERYDAAVTYLAEVANRRTAEVRIIAGARAIEMALGLRAPSRHGLSRATRTRLHTLLMDDDTAAYIAAFQIANGSSDIDPDMLELLQDVTPSEASEWLDFDKRTVHVLALSAVIPTPPVRQVTRQAMVAALRQSVEPEFRRGITQLVALWCAYHADIVGCRFRGTEERAKTDSEALSDAQAFSAALAKFSSVPAAPYLGATVVEAARFFTKLCDEIEASPSDETPAVEFPERPADRRRATARRLLHVV